MKTSKLLVGTDVDEADPNLPMTVRRSHTLGCTTLNERSAALFEQYPNPIKTYMQADNSWVEDTNSK